jgi:hypothetical protein
LAARDSHTSIGQILSLGWRALVLASKETPDGKDRSCLTSIPSPLEYHTCLRITQELAESFPLYLAAVSDLLG